MAETKKCEHPACSCTARDGDNYCSEYCAAARDTTEIACNCGHATCAGVVGGAGRVNA